MGSRSEGRSRRLVEGRNVGQRRPTSPPTIPRRRQSVKARPAASVQAAQNVGQVVGRGRFRPLRGALKLRQRGQLRIPKTTKAGVWRPGSLVETAMALESLRLSDQRNHLHSKMAFCQSAQRGGDNSNDAQTSHRRGDAAGRTEPGIPAPGTGAEVVAACRSRAAIAQRGHPPRNTRGQPWTSGQSGPERQLASPSPCAGSSTRCM